jgi:hypothetical protein
MGTGDPDEHVCVRHNVSKHWVVSSSSRKRPLNDSHQPFFPGDPGSMAAVPVPANRHQSVPHRVVGEFGSAVHP